MPESFYNQATGRLSIEDSKCFCTCNPNSPYHWFYRNVIMKLKEKNGLYVHFIMEDNTTLSEETINRYKTMYSGVFYDRYILGKWVLAQGLIYDMFNKKLNIVRQEDIPYDDAVSWCIAVDYGTGNATVFLLMMKDSKGIIYVCKEYYFAGRKEAEEANDYEAQKTDLEFAEDMKSFIGVNYAITNQHYRTIDIMVDPAASSFKLQLVKLHMRAKNANNEVINGIRNVATYIKNGELKIAKDCIHTIKEIYTYSWDEKAQLIGVDKPLKSNDHCMDAMRYGVAKLKDKNKIANATRNIGI